MQIIKPTTLSLISKTYRLQTDRTSIGVLCFFKLGDEDQLLVENEQWARIMPLLNQGQILDMGYAKPVAELLVAGSAFASNAQPVSRMEVSVAMAGIDKKITVVGDRFWQNRLWQPLSEPQPFLQMPLDYAHAYGGAGFANNTLGKGVIAAVSYDAEAKHYPLANLFYPDEWDQAVKQSKRPACFTPLDISGPQRAQHQGTYDQDWLENQHPGFPVDTGPELFNAAAEDQRISGFFQPGEPYCITGMHPDIAEIRGCLPQKRVRAFITQQDKGFIEVKTRIDTVWFFPELELGVAIYRGHVEVQDSLGLDVSQVLLAYENSDDSPRPMAYYQHIMQLRTDPETAAAHLLNESQRMPEKSDAEKH